MDHAVDVQGSRADRLEPCWFACARDFCGFHPALDNSVLGARTIYVVGSSLSAEGSPEVTASTPAGRGSCASGIVWSCFTSSAVDGT